MTQRQFLVLHGIENHRPAGHWQHWLTRRLRARGEQVVYPQLPDADDPSREAWGRIVRAELDLLGERERVVVCHSLACAFWLWLAADRSIAVDRVLLVSPPDPVVLERVAPEFASFPAERSGGACRIVASDADPYNPRGARATYGALSAPLDIVVGGGHITPADGFGPWPGVERWCLDPQASLARGEGDVAA